MGYELVDVSEADDWAAFHAIRRIELFEAKGRFGIYNANHPDDYADFAHPLLLKCDARPVGTTRLDLLGDGRAAVRLVAITHSEQGTGHGRVLSEAVERKARALGVNTLGVNAAATAVGYYDRTGWHRHVWDRDELIGIASECIQMRKSI